MGICASTKDNKSHGSLNPIAWMRANYPVDVIPIGKGHFGNVFKGKSLDGETVAVKIISKKKLSEEERAGLENEARTLECLHHPSVLHIIDHSENEEYIVLVTEYVAGKTLQEVAHMKGRRFSEQKVATIALQLLQALSYCHEHGVMHRDVKLDNVIVTPKGSVRLIDFGLAV